MRKRLDVYSDYSNPQELLNNNSNHAFLVSRMTGGLVKLITLATFGLMLFLSSNQDSAAVENEVGRSSASNTQENPPSLCKACQRIFNDPVTPIYPAINKKCSNEKESDRTWCEARNLAVYYLKREQVLEFLVLFDNMVRGCPTPQMREYSKERLYYLATKLDNEDFPFTEYRDFDFGPIDTSILGQLRAHGSSDIRGKEYQMAIAKHHPGKHKFLERILEQCKNTQKAAPLGLRP